MKRVWAALWAGVFFLGCLSFAFAGDVGTAAEAEAMVKKAVDYMKAHGKEKAFAEFNNPKGQFVDRDLYITVYDMNAKCLAHGANAKMIGKDLIGMKDPDGKEWLRERVNLAKTKEKFWQDYKFTNPLTKKIEPKSMYCVRVEDVIVACGIYKK